MLWERVPFAKFILVVGKSTFREKFILVVGKEYQRDVHSFCGKGTFPEKFNLIVGNGTLPFEKFILVVDNFPYKLLLFIQLQSLFVERAIGLVERHLELHQLAVQLVGARAVLAGQVLIGAQRVLRPVQLFL